MVGKRRCKGFWGCKRNSRSCLLYTSAHVADIGWMDWVTDGNIAGTTGKNKQMEAIKIRLTGEIANYYNVYYRVHVSDYGWLDWAENGDVAGTTDAAKKMEAIQIKLVDKKSKAPGSITQSYKMCIRDSQCIVIIKNVILSMFCKIQSSSSKCRIRSQ